MRDAEIGLDESRSHFLKSEMEMSHQCHMQRRVQYHVRYSSVTQLENLEETRKDS